MQTHKNEDKKYRFRVLSIYPTTRGCAFALFDSPLSPHDWGTKSSKQDVGSAKCIEGIKEMLTRFRPGVLVLEDMSERQTKRSLRVARILKAVTSTARDLCIEIALVRRKDVRAVFAQFGATNKHDIAKVIAGRMVEFAPRVPKARKAWEAEDQRMGVFDAASRALTYYYRLEDADA